MLNFSDQSSPISSPDEYPISTSSELSRLLLDQEMDFVVAATFSSSPLSTTLLQQYLFLSHNLKWIWQDLVHHQQERESIFDVLSHSVPFQDIITPIVLNFWFRQRHVSPVNPLSPAFRAPSNPSIPEREVEQRSVIIQEQSDSDNSLLSYYTTAHEEPGTCNNHIDVEWLLDPSPSPPHTPVYTPPWTWSAPVTSPCALCHRHGHTSIQCVWNGPRVCSYCEKVGHMIHNCSIFHQDRQCFDPHLLYCLTCKQSGHTSTTCSTFLSHCWISFKSGILGSLVGGNVTNFSIYVYYQDYFCYCCYQVIFVIFFYLLWSGISFIFVIFHR